MGSVCCYQQLRQCGGTSQTQVYPTQLSDHPNNPEVNDDILCLCFSRVVTGILVYMAIERCVSGEFELNPTIMLITSGVGVLVNIVMGAVLGHSHGGSGHSHGGATATDSEGGHGHNSAEQGSDSIYILETSPKTCP